MKRAGKLGVLLAGILGSARLVHAHCPLCVAAVGAGILGAKSIGLGDAVVGLFVGAFAVSTGLWVSQKIRTRFIPLQSAGILAASFALTVFPLQPMATETLFVPVFLAGPSGTPLNQAYFITAFLAAGILGGLITLAGGALHSWIKTRNGRVFFPFQGVVLTLGLLLLAAGVLIAAGGS